MPKESIDLGFIQKQFLCCTPPNKFNWNNSNNDRTCLDTMSLETQQQILDETVNYDLVKNYPIKRSYQKAFLKLLIDKLEQNNQEIHDDMYNIYCSLVSSDDKQNSTQYKHFIYDDQCDKQARANAITIQESVNIVSFGTTGLCTWQAGLALANWCMTNRELLSGRKILELGCGVGLTGLAVIHSCLPSEYIFSDVHPAVLTMLCKNILINFPPEEEHILNTGSSNGNVMLQVRCNGINVQAVRLPWEEINDCTNETNFVTDIDVVLAADVLYDKSSFHGLATALGHLLKSNGSYAIIAATVRNADTISQFTRILGSHNLVYEETQLPKWKFFIQTDDTPVQMIKVVKSNFLGRKIVQS